jgi:23S rRNA methylase
MKQQSTLGIRTTPENEFRRASRNVHVNPFEFLSIDLDGNPLISRSALKLANMDALVDFCLCCCTCPVESSAKPNRNSSDNNDNDNNDNNFLFVDLCGAPGGFSQYILFRRLKHQQQQQQQQQRATDTETNAESDTLVQHPIGYGMSLGGENCDGRGIEWDKTLERGKEQPFKVHFGSDGTGDIYNWDNVLSLQHTISKDWNRRSRVDLVVADGGFDAQRDCEDQEGLATNLVICQVAAAFQLLERGGNFVLKMFGFQSLAMRYVMETLVEQFETVKIVKPIASRPASAERYVIAMGFRQCGKWNHHDDDAAATRDLDALTQWAFEWRRDGLLMGEQQRRGRKNVQELEEETTNRSVLDQSLDRFDWDMASLNMDACEKYFVAYRNNKRDL